MPDNLVNVSAGEARSPRQQFLVPTLLRGAKILLPPKWLHFARSGVSDIAEHLPLRWRSKMGWFIDRMRGPGAFIERDYAAWIALHQQMDQAAESAVKLEIDRFPKPPLISVLMPVYNPSPDHLRAAIQSVQKQLYPHWELCIADDASSNAAIAELLSEMQAQDARIKIIWRKQNGHISAASNSALQLATGTFIALLDHDDLLSPRALYEVASRIIGQPDVDIIYSDEDRVDEAGRRSHPYFKPGWNPELMLGQNLISHLGVYRRSLVDRVGGFRLGFEGSQDWDLALRTIAETQHDRIVHIPSVLYHWRQGARAYTFSQGSHDRCVLNGRRAVAEFAARGQIDVKVVPAPLVETFTRVIHPVPAPEPLVSVILAVGDNQPPLARCIDGLLHGTSYAALEIVIAFSGENEPRTLAAIRHDVDADPRVRVLRHPEPCRDPVLKNWAVQQAHGSVILLLSPDLAACNADWLGEMVSHAIRPGAGAVGAKLLDAEGRIQHAGFTVGLFGVAGEQFAQKYRTNIGYFGHLQLNRNVTAVSADCLAVQRDAFMAVGGLNETALEAAFSDVDLCLKLVERGYCNRWTPYAELSYSTSKSFRWDETGDLKTRFHQETAYMKGRWGSRLLNDPYWNPNLSVAANELVLAFSRRNANDLDARAA